MSISGPAEPQYHSAEYWEQEYKAPESRGDWYANYACLRPILAKLLGPTTNHILITGCGDSDLGRGLYCDGYQHLVSVDISQSVIDKMNAAKQPGETQRCPLASDQLSATITDHLFKDECMDVTKMTYTADIFDMVLDKACIDALCTSGETIALARQALAEELRVLRPSGWIFLISFAGPDIYDLLLSEFQWKSRECDKLTFDWGVYHLYKLQKV